MPTYIRVKDLPNSASSLNADDFIMLSGSVGGARKIEKADFLSTVADSFNAAPSTYKLATLDAGNKVDASQWPASAFSYQGTWAASSNTPTLANGSGTAGYTYYASNSGSVNFGAGAISFTAGDAVVYDGSIWQKVPDVANILDGAATAEQGRTALDVNSIAQDAESDGTKLQGPSMRFDGSYVEFADNDAFSFTNTNGTDDTPFSVSAWVKPETNAQFVPMARYGGSGSREFLFYSAGSGGIKLYLCNAADTNRVTVTMDAALTLNEWQHISVTYSGAGPNSANSFANAQNGVAIYLNGKAVATTASNNSYAGMSATDATTLIGKQGSNHSKGEIRDVKLFNKSLSAAEVKTLCLSGSLPESFAESTGGAEIYAGDSSTFAGGLGNWTEEGSTSLTVAASGGEMVITNTSGASGGTKGARNLTDNVVEGKKLRLTFTSRCSSGTATGFTVKMFNGSQATSATKIQGSGTASTGSSAVYSFTPTGSNETHIVEFVLAGAATDNLYFNLSADGTGEVYNFNNITLTQIGSVLDARAEQFDTSTGKLYDLSGNGFVGTQSGGVSLLGRKMPIYETGTWTVGLEFGGTALAVASQTGTWTRIGDLVHIAGAFNLSSIAGIGSGNARITGLPFTAEAQTSRHGITFVLTVGMTGLTSAVVGNVLGGDTDIAIYQWGSTGTASLTNANFTASTYSRFSGFYQIS